MFTNYPFMMRPNILAKTTTKALGFNWAGLLDGAQKTLGIVNQAIPIVYQVKPIVNNAKTMFKIADALKSDEVEKKNIQPTEKKEVINQPIISNKPIFYI